MTPKRSTFDPLQPSFIPAPTWLVVRNMAGAVLDSQEIPAGTDLRRFFIATMLQWIDAGWELGEFSSTAPTFFCTRRNERRMVGIQPIEPGHVRDTGASALQQCPGCGD